MQTRNLGRSGLRVSLLGLGCNNFGSRLDGDATRAVVHAAMDQGVTLFDTASNYGEGRSETLLGAALGPRRKDIVLATKFGTRTVGASRHRDASRTYLMASVEASLTALGTDWIDLLQLHWPDPTTPIDETLRALDDLVSAGKVRYIGCSNMPGWRLADAAWTARSSHLAGFISSQEEYSLLARGIEDERLPAMSAFGVGLIAYSPLASGLLTGKYRPGERPPKNSRLASAGIFTEKFLNENNLRRAFALSEICGRYDLALRDAALLWLASKPAVSSVAAAAMSPAQLVENAAALERHLPAELAAELESAT
jgi:aryl-alcohol dehydrogenase-like predicted oxidoreductase